MNMNNREDKDLAILCNAKSDDLKGLYDDVSNELYRYGGNTIKTFFRWFFFSAIQIYSLLIKQIG